MQKLISAVDNLPMIIKIILALPGVDIIWVIYRLARSIEKQNLIGIILAVVLIVGSFSVLWIIDILCLIVTGKVWWLD